MSKSITYKGQTYTQKSLYDLRGPEIVALYNQMADKPTKRFSSMKNGVDRTWALLEAKGKPAEAAAPVASKPAPAPAPAAAKAKATKPATTPASKAPHYIAAGVAPEGRPGVNHAIHAIAAKSGPTEREELVTKILADYTPPRSGAYDRNYVMAYIAHGLVKGYLKEVPAA